MSLRPSPLGARAPLGGARFENIENLVVFDVVTSTNDVARAFVESLLADDSEILVTVVSARVQTQGRGRSGRTWLTFPGDALAVSLVTPWPEGPGRVRVPMLRGLALARGLSERYGLDVKLKWPNDLVVAGRKLGGLLVEARVSGEEGYAITGIGLNVGASRAELDAQGLSGATSLAECGVDPARLRGEVPLLVLLEILDEALGEEDVDIPAAFSELGAHREGDLLEVRDGEKGEKKTGRFLGVTADGFLRLETGDGVETILSGDAIQLG